MASKWYHDNCFYYYYNYYYFERWHVTTFPLVLNNHSDWELVAGTHRYFFATFLGLGTLPHGPSTTAGDLINCQHWQTASRQTTLFQSALSVRIWQRMLLPFWRSIQGFFFFGGSDTVGAWWGCKPDGSAAPWLESDSIASISDMALHLISSTLSSAMYLVLNLWSTKPTMSSRSLVAGSSNFSHR